ncbi:sentrin-specific protease 6 isoform X6 [Xiphias gladius]|uniref:sentrin-specific protease 6 isoform X6 n=1 Tax=Xiphias gladius TaxID=8245 RepID=UPI001A99B640|nr:sentrin-specific protease 6 isoform X6 [Xiphias gladius]
MAHNRSFFFEALDRSETRRDGGYKHNWSFSLSGDSEEERRHDASVVSMEEMDRQQPTSPEEKKSPTLRHFTSSDPLRTYENRPNNHMRPLNRLGPKKLSEVPLSVATSSPMPNRTNYFIISPAPPQGIVLQGRHFQHAQMPSAIRKPVQRNDFSTTQQAVEVDSIVLTCPEIPEEALNIKRRVQQKRKPLEGCCSFPSQVKATEFGNQPPEQFSPRTKKPKIMSNKCDSIILECRSVRVGTLRRMVTKPVVFSIDHIQLETEGPERDSIEKVCLQASELISCEWCSVRKLPVLFFQTSPEECNRLRSQLNMSKEKGGQWYDCAGDQSDEKYIVLIFENGLAMKEQMILEDILGEIGRTNSLSNFPAKLPFEEANIRLVNYNKATKQKEEKAKPIQSPPKMSQGSPAGKVPHATQVAPVTPVTMPVRTRMATRQQTSAYFEDEDEDMTDLQPTFSGPIVKLMVYPPPPAKGGISVTNEDLHCLNDGEFLNDVIIDFYLKYLVLEKLKKEDAQRIHVFSSFFYKRLNQRERRNVPDTANLPIQKRKHNRVKTWTRHVDLFQKDFIFVPINESAHWYLAVICFPGLEGPVYEQNPLYHGPLPASALAADPTSEENIPDHCRPLSPDRDGLDSSSEQPSPAVPEASGDGQPDADAAKENSAFADGGQEPSGTPTTSSNGQADAERQYTSELHRISVCYSSRKGDDDTYTFSDDQSSCQVLGSLCPLICLLVTLMDECSEDGTLAEDTLSSDASGLASKPNLCKQPCILIMDSLRGPARSTVVKTLREYLEVEWEVRKGTQRSFGKDVMRGSSPRVPQQDNFSDCGVYILQYVESFFENPIPTFHLPVNLSEWFPQQRMKTKREEIKELILKIQAQQELDREEPDQAEAPPGSPEDPEIEETSGSAGPPPNLPISP